METNNLENLTRDDLIAIIQHQWQADTDRFARVERIMEKQIDNYSVLIEKSEARIDKTNEMLRVLANSASDMASAATNMKQMTEHLTKKYLHHIDQVVASRNEIIALNKNLVEILKNLSNKPTMANYNT